MNSLYQYGKAWWYQLWQIPRRLSPRAVKIIGPSAMVTFAFAATVPLLFEGWSGVAFMVAFALLGLSNLVVVLGSILPEESGGEAVRRAVVPLVPVTLLACIAAVAVHLAGGEDPGLGSVITGGITAFVGVKALERRRSR
jgi:hypothetical protein